LISKSEALLFDKLEHLYNVIIERQHYLSYRTYDGKYKKFLIEIDGKKWHMSNKSKANDKFKMQIAQNFGYQLIRIKLNSCKEIDTVLNKNKDLFDRIFKQ